VLTNAHVAGKCTTITVTRQGGAPVPASLVKADTSNDLAVLITQPSPSVAAFRSGRPVRAGETVVAFGFPLSSMLASGGIVTNGSISALSGLGDDSRYLQISAPVQPGNSGGPLLDSSGNIVGVVTLTIRAATVMRQTGSLPQNINFALKADVARTFLESAGVPVETAASARELSVADIGEKARAFSVFIECKN
jgi:S1-C subfamily serine protease